MNIFEIQQSKEDKEFLHKNLAIEFDAAADILDSACYLPYLGSLFKLGKVAVNMRDWHFMNKLGKFIEQVNDIEQSDIDQFISKLQPEQNSRISKYLIHLLYNAEEERKAEILGKIYRARLLSMVDNEMMLRLCSIIGHIFVDDLQHLQDFVEPVNKKDSYADILNAYGLLDVSDAPSINNGTLSLGGIKCQLNKIGSKLLEILNM